MNGEKLELVMGYCAACKGPMTACPQCVNTIRIDPKTDLPPDVKAGPNGEPVRIRPTPEALARSKQVMLCDNCVRMRNSRYDKEHQIETAESRHSRHEFNDREWDL